jgi:hypothetical protein
MAGTGVFYWNDRLGKTDPRTLTLVWNITGAKTVVSAPIGQPVLPTYDAISSQATINDFLGTVDEFTTAQFDATAMGADAFGFLVDMQGQCQSLVGMEVTCYSSTGGATAVTRYVKAGTLAASTLETAVQLGAYGNLAGKIDFGNTPDFDALTSGSIVVKLHWVSK